MLSVAAVPVAQQSALGAPRAVAHHQGQPELAAVWVPRKPLPQGRAEIGVAALGGRMHVIGGTLDAGGELVWSSTNHTVYDPRTDSWRELAPLPSPLTHAGVGTLDGKLYVVGGFLTPVHIQPQSVAYVYDPRRNSWATLPPLPEALGSVSVAGIGHQVHVFGGRDSSTTVPIDTGPGGPPLQGGLGTVRDHFVYDPRTARWTRSSPVPGPARDHQGIAVLGDRIHLVGGRVEDVDQNLVRHDVYDPYRDRWTTAAPLPQPRSSGAIAVVRGRIVFAGGECGTVDDGALPDAYSDVYAYSPERDRWSPLTGLPAPRHAFGAATIDGTMYVTGGAARCGGGATTDTWALRTR